MVQVSDFITPLAADLAVLLPGLLTDLPHALQVHKPIVEHHLDGLCFFSLLLQRAQVLLLVLKLPYEVFLDGQELSDLCFDRYTCLDFVNSDFGQFFDFLPSSPDGLFDPAYLF